MAEWITLWGPHDFIVHAICEDDVLIILDELVTSGLLYVIYTCLAWLIFYCMSVLLYCFYQYKRSALLIVACGLTSTKVTCNHLYGNSFVGVKE